MKSLGESGSEVSHFIPDPRNFAEVTKLSDNIKTPWLTVPRFASAVTLAHARAHGAGPPRTVQQHRKLFFKGIRDPEEMVMD